MGAEAASTAMNDEKLSRIDSYVKEQFKAGGFPGGAYAIVYRDKIMAAEGIGLAEKNRSGCPRLEILALVSV